MHLTSLEMQGFKSFPERTVIEFHEGITAIVGPNGSGKSNVTDAIRWVLGEQSAKSLRGDKMEDIVFNGTANRRAMGFAEVAINFDNSDNVLPVEYNHVRIVRRYYRSGESEYMINQTPCRLKDITNLLMDTGIGRDGYSLVSQGKVDEILSSKSEDRRRIFDEASGIVKYKTRKLETERKLSRTDANLIRINDIIGELSTRIDPLKEQADKARTYLEISAELKKLDIALLLHQLTAREEEAAKLEELKQQLAADLSDVEANILTIRQRNEGIGQSIKEKEACIEKLRADHGEKLDRQSLLTNNIGLLREQNKHLEKEKSEAVAEQERLARSRELLETEKETREHKRKVLERQREAFSTQLLEVEAEYQAILAKMDEQARDQEIRRQVLAETREKIFAADTAKVKLESEAELHKRQVEDIGSHKTELAAELTAHYQERDARKRELEADLAKTTQIEEENNNNMRLLQEKNDRLMLLRDEKQKCDQNIRDLEYQQSTLMKLEESLEGYHAPVKKIMQKVQSDPGFAPDVKGPLASLIEVEQAYATAIEIALGASANHIVTATEDSAKNLIAWLKDTKNGRATFLPVETIKSRQFDKQTLESAAGHPGCLGVAADLVTSSAEIDEIIGNILGKTFVVKDLTQALSLADKLRHSCRIVTLEGEIINPGGSITGGSINRSSTGIIGRSGRITELGRDIKKLQNQNSDLSDQITIAQKELNSAEELNKELLQKLQEIEAESKSITLQIENIEQRIEKLESEKQQQEKRQADLETAMEKILLDLQTRQTEISENENRLGILSSEIEQESSQREADRAKRNSLRERVTDLKVSLGSIEQTLSGILDFVSHLAEQSAADSVRHGQLDDIISDSTKAQAENSVKLLKYESDIEKIHNEISGLTGDVTDHNKEKELLESERQRLFQNLEAQAESMAAVKGELGKAEEAFLRLQQNNDLLRNRLWEDYELTFATADDWRQEMTSVHKSQRELNQLKVKIKDLGSVNIDAINEYDAVSDRYSFMERQRNDIEQSRKDLTDLIRDLDKAMEEQFNLYFKEISQNFDTVFRELFGGGYAELLLEDPEDMLATDIVIKAQPPGKRLQNLNLLSGGERSLTAIALLFAIFKLKPAPFCVFDEVESTLDDANVLRFTDYISRYADETQFILVTHRKGTMEASERLYGVTMQERGVSSIYSMKLSDYANNN
ncbi:MAG TPA: chromosome segregation protein SMC [Clostridiaceae bacterium]|nr:chromosome segregation protein SMC [Clostridiaceae bacterium]